MGFSASCAQISFEHQCVSSKLQEKKKISQLDLEGESFHKNKHVEAGLGRLSEIVSFLSKTRTKLP